MNSALRCSSDVIIRLDPRELYVEENFRQGPTKTNVNAQPKNGFLIRPSCQFRPGWLLAEPPVWGKYGHSITIGYDRDKAAQLNLIIFFLSPVDGSVEQRAQQRDGHTAAIIGAGPGGFYTAHKLLQSDPDIKVGLHIIMF